MTIHKILKISLLDRVYTITTDEDEQCILRAAHCINELFKTSTGNVRRLPGDIEKETILALLQLAVDLDKARNDLHHINDKIESLNKVVSLSL